MQPEELVERHPSVFHVAAAESWPSIRRHGLLSTEALLDLHGLTGRERELLLRRPRPASRMLSTPGVGVAVVRDQKPLKFVAERIEPGSTLPQFLGALNARVFFAADRERLDRLLGAKAYRGLPQVVLEVSTRLLVERYAVELCRFNSGAVMYRSHPLRGHLSWVPLADYPYDDHRRRHGRRGALAEVTVPWAVPDVLDIVERVEHVTPPA